MAALRFDRIVFFLFVGLLALILAACGGGAGDEDLPSAEIMIPGEANVEAIEPELQGTSPLFASVNVRGFLPDACTQLGQVNQQVDNNRIVIRLETVRSIEENCAQVVTPFEETLPLNVNGLAPGNYTVDVNGISADLVIPDHEQVAEEVIDACPPAPPGMSLYVNSQLGFCLHHPTRYSVQETTRSEVTLAGPQFSEGIEPVTVAMTVELLGPAEGRTPEQIADERLADYANRGFELHRGYVRLAETEALQIDGVPGRYFSRQAYVVAGDQAYILTISPVDVTIPAPSNEAGLLWNDIVRSLTFFAPVGVPGDQPDTCSPNAEFVADVTVPDGTQIPVGQSFIKTWRLRNSGDCAWGNDYLFDQLDFFDNLLQADPQTITVPPVEPGEEVELSVNMTLSAQAQVGAQYSGLFQLKDPNGETFGVPAYVLIEAVAP
ncbi:MAG TPA: NBR1-Ig-like domain-containing protein [Anaerolineales bacterium]|nr:NBR1-Ig-like domain-containing protein [Anaerolineales bacterium]